MKPQHQNNDSEYAALLKKISIFCAKRERSQQEVRNKIKAINGEQYTRDLIELLQKEDLLNEERYIVSFVTEKFRGYHWGKLKITNALTNQNIDKKLINSALLLISDEEYRDALKQLILKAEKQTNVFNSMIYKGYEEELIITVLQELGIINE